MKDEIKLIVISSTTIFVYSSFVHKSNNFGWMSLFPCNVDKRDIHTGLLVSQVAALK